MGTNFYATTEPPCPHCGAGGERLHIGKSSIGWEFLFAPYPELGLTSFAAWKAFLASREIRDEYGDPVMLADLEALVEAKRGLFTARTAPDSAWGPFGRDCENTDADGYRFCDTADFS